MLDKLKIRKEIIGIGLLGWMIQAQAEVLVILPDSGTMARASNSIKSGIQSAYKASGSQIPLKFISNDQKKIQQILAENVNKNTQLVIGPLARNDVNELIKSNPKIPVLALNEVTDKSPKVWQFSLAKSDDANALIEQIFKDKIEHLYIMRESGTEAESLAFVNAFFKSFPEQVSIVEELPKLKNKDGVLLLGKVEWIQNLKNKPNKQIYLQAVSITENSEIPMGAKFCDVPMLFNALSPAQKNEILETNYAFQRLNAFGYDAWTLAEKILWTTRFEQSSFIGKTGLLSFKNNRIERKPTCYEKTWFRLKPL